MELAVALPAFIVSADQRWSRPGGRLPGWAARLWPLFVRPDLPRLPEPVLSQIQRPGLCWFAASGPAAAAAGWSDDSELLDAAKRGKRLAFQALYQRYAPQILGFLQRQTGDGSAAEDLLQEVFIRAFRSLDRFQGRSSFRTWLFVIARNRVHSHWARVKPREQMGDSDSALNLVPDDAASPLEVLQQRELLTAVERALGRMRPAQREIFLLRHTHQLSYEELAEVLELPIGTVKSRLTRAIAEFWRVYRGGDR